MQDDSAVRAQPSGSARWRIARLLFELLYRNRTLYWLASTLPFAGQWRVWQRLALARLRGADVLEIGCGPGWLLADMVERGYRCQAIDRSPEMVAAARSTLRRRGLSAEAQNVRLASAQALPFADAAFDSVVATFPTDYIADATALREIRRVLRPRGRLIVVLAATLLPTRALLRPLVALQRLVYGRQAVEAQASARTEFGAPLLANMRAAGFTPRMEAAPGPFWVAYVITATAAAQT